MAPRPEYVTVVSGVPRSGTSLMMQMLGAGGLALLVDGRRGPDPDNPRGYLEYDPVKRLRRDASWLGAAAGRAVKVVHLLVPSLPPDRDYRMILMRRDLREVAASQRAMLERSGAAADELPDARLVEILAAQLDEAERWARAQPRFEVLCVEHGALLSDPKAGATRVDGFLGGGLDVAAMAQVVDPSLYRSRR
jgi:hypothetical protein